jgi:diguanylate cyclase (GGDEF)-like protein
LQAVAARLLECARETTLIARLGGDEFAVIEYVENPDCGGGHARRAHQKALCEPFDLGDNSVIAGTSIGIAVAPRDGTDCDEILKSADLALYSAKSGGRGSFRFFRAGA